jgi:hypothetical protein
MLDQTVQVMRGRSQIAYRISTSATNERANVPNFFNTGIICAINNITPTCLGTSDLQVNMHLRKVPVYTTSPTTHYVDVTEQGSCGGTKVVKRPVTYPVRLQTGTKWELGT